jgi:hydroxymethylglutaryl-CoA lyase
MNKHIKIVEVGPRDGLQNEKSLVPTESKLDFIRKLLDAGLRYIEVTSFVHPRAVPQLADAADVARGLPSAPDAHFSALVPNMKGLERALEAGIREVAVLTAVSETFNRRNINMSIAESLTQMKPVVERARQAGLTVRGYLSTAFYCPFEGKMDENAALDITQRLRDLGVPEVSIGDTIGQATPFDVRQTLGRILTRTPVDAIAMHFHDTNGLALENVQASLDLGVRIFDSSAGGIGGCPYAPGASGNLSTDALVAYLQERGYETGIDPEKLKTASATLLRLLARTETLLEDIGNLEYIGNREE